MTQASCPSVHEIDATAAIAEPILRNAKITAGYARVSRAFAEWLPGAANWCSFATWASRQAGYTIRKENLAHAVAQRLQRRLSDWPLLREVHRIFGIPGERLSWIVGELSQGLPGIDRASDALARGNQSVFGDIAREFARFMADAAHGGDEAVRAFSARFRSGPPPEGQDLMREAFASFVAARATGDPSARAQLILLANTRIGVHEQTRVQPEVVEAMDAALLDVADTRRRIIDRLDALVAAGPFGRVHTGAGRLLLNAVADEIAGELRLIARMIVTERLMTIELPGGRTLRLGSDVTGAFPAGLVTLTNPDLIALLAEVDATPDTTRGSAAVDWAVLSQRLHFITDFFRAYQADPSLLDPPFDAAQLAAIEAGRLPDRL